jgi:hypothetical protein
MEVAAKSGAKVMAAETSWTMEQLPAGSILVKAVRGRMVTVANGFKHWNLP